MSALHAIERSSFGALLSALRARGYTILGPTIRDGAIVYGMIEGEGDLPVGWTEDQDAGSYRLRRRGDARLFGYALGPNSFKEQQLPAQSTLWRARIGPDGALGEPREPPPPKERFALLGARSCELSAASILERVLAAAGRDPDAPEAPFVVAVQCGEAGGTCFCASMGTGPVAERGFDLALTEVLEGDRHYFVTEVGSELGAEVLAEVPHAEAGEPERLAAEAVHTATAASMGRTLETDDLKGLLYRNLEHPRWDEVAERCLACGNCTMVCPTCFCTTVEDVTDLAGENVERRRSWDSCFTVDYSYIHGGSVRSSARSRYRQWMTHKLATWWDQFDSSGCVGCGRCITWCPVGIDITEEAGAIRQSEGAPDANDR